MCNALVICMTIVRNIAMIGESGGAGQVNDEWMEYVKIYRDYIEVTD